MAERDDDTLFQRRECADEPGPVKRMWLEMRVAPSGTESRFGLAIGCNVSAGPLTRPRAAMLSRQLGRGDAGNIGRVAALAESAHLTP